jgi:DNA-binding transcriptional regulator YhcF (GntR family)
MIVISMDFSSDEALYVQLCNQIILGIATSQIHEGESLPSVRQMADEIGINMHTVNKAYAILRQEGYIKLDRRKGAVIAVDVDHLQAVDDVAAQMRTLVARAICKGVSGSEIHGMVDDILEEYGIDAGDD